MKDKLKTIWANVTPRQKRNLVLLAMATVVLAFSLAGYLFKTRDGGTVLGKSAQKKKEITLDAGLLEKSAYLEGRKEIARTEEKLSLLQKELDEIKEEKAKVSRLRSTAARSPMGTRTGSSLEKRIFSETKSPPTPSPSLWTGSS